MKNDIFTFLVGGKAGEGVKKAGAVAAKIFSTMGRHLFQLDDYMSLIRGGHNFSVISTSTRWISSHYMKANLVINFDKRSYDLHFNDISTDNGIIIYNSDEQEKGEGIGIPFSSEAKKYPMKSLMYGVGAVAILASSIGFKKEEMNNIIKAEYPSGIKDNISFADLIYDLVNSQLGSRFVIEKGDLKRPILTGNEALSLGAIASGLDVYYGYPMTPASSILHYLAKLAPDFGLAVVHPESELAVINMGIGSSFTGARAMVGTSGGGFALMTEGISLAGMTETPILIVLSMRPGPATGVPTYTEQADLNFALNAGHGEFLRIVASPGTVEEAYYLAAELLDLVWKFQTPGILLTEKHLSESGMTVDINMDETKWAEPKKYEGNDYKRYLDTDDGISPLIFPPSNQLIKWNSYEHDEMGLTTENPKIISKMHDKRHKKLQALEKYMQNLHTVNVIGNEGPEIFTYGSTTMSVLEALKYGNIKAKVIQPIYLKPFPIWELNKYKEKEVIVIEMSKAGQFANLLKEKVGIEIKNLINKYDGRPFDPIELSQTIKEAI
jgi:2-oxoglutarate ferredoxin oxidoreductase subunit alpha